MCGTMRQRPLLATSLGGRGACQPEAGRTAENSTVDPTGGQYYATNAGIHLNIRDIYASDLAVGFHAPTLQSLLKTFGTS